MKLLRYKIIVLTLFSLCALSCKKSFLEVVPQGRQIARTTNDYQLLMDYDGLAQYTFAGGWQGQAIMGDEVAAESSMFTSAKSVSQNAFRWEDNIFQISDTDWSTRIWMENLYQLNKIINEVMASSGGSEQQKLSILAEAKASRAWIYFQLINFYGKPYLESTAASDPGFPIILTSDINARGLTRSSVKQVYDFIISDLTAAIANLPINPKNGIHFNKSAAEGILGKVYLFMGRNAQALVQLNSAISDNAARTQPAKLYDYNVEFASGGKFTPMNYNGPNNAPGLDYNDFTESMVSRSFYNSAYSGNGYGNDPFVLSPSAQSLFAPSDLRLKFYAAEFPYSTPNPSGRLRKYAVDYTQFGLQISELYLLSAEAKARGNDLAGARADLQFLRQNRMPIGDAAISDGVASDQKALLAFIFEERIREFAMEGYRWFDMRRLSVDPLFAAKSYTHILYNYQNNTQTVSTLRPVRLTMRLPVNIMNANPEFINNP